MFWEKSSVRFIQTLGCSWAAGFFSGSAASETDVAARLRTKAPQAIAEAFIALPFVASEVKRCYRTRARPALCTAGAAANTSAIDVPGARSRAGGGGRMSATGALLQENGWFRSILRTIEGDRPSIAR
jgi:hypothetical protein